MWIVNTCLDRGNLPMMRVVNLPKLRIPPLPGEESESGPDPSLLVSDPDDEGTRVSPVPLGPFFQGQRDTSRPPDGPRRADDSIQSNGSGDSDHQGQWSVPPYVRLAPLLRRIQTLKSKVGSLQVTLPESFGIVHGELNEVWPSCPTCVRLRLLQIAGVQAPPRTSWNGVRIPLQRWGRPPYCLFLSNIL